MSHPSGAERRKWGTLIRAFTPPLLISRQTPIDLTRILKVSKPMIRVAYQLAEQQPGVLARLVQAAVAAPVTAR